MSPRYCWLFCHPENPGNKDTEAKFTSKSRVFARLFDGLLKTRVLPPT